ncbi:MAG: hypothetical protein HPY53_16915 [Brevinematales bacterium]|nr:hypothetical protein [Brevinematales bacterium]
MDVDSQGYEYVSLNPNPPISPWCQNRLQLKASMEIDNEDNYGILKIFRILLFFLKQITQVLYFSFIFLYRYSSIKKGVWKQHEESTIVDIYIVTVTFLSIASGFLWINPDDFVLKYVVSIILVYFYLGLLNSLFSILVSSNTIQWKPLNYTRSFIIAFLNYIQIIFSFAFLYFVFGKFTGEEMIPNLKNYVNFILYSFNSSVFNNVHAKDLFTKIMIILHDFSIFFIFGVALSYFVGMISSQKEKA